MSTKQLFPVFDVPEVNIPAQPEREQYRPSVFFDFAAGDFVRGHANRIVEAEGKEAYMQWCMKVIATERDAFLAYSTKIGTEMDYAVAQPDHQSVEAAVQRTIVEALMVNPKTEYVRDFQCTWDGSSLYCWFMVKGRHLDEIRLSATIKTD